MIVRPVSSRCVQTRSTNALPASLARRSLPRELLLDHVLGRDPRMVVARLPERVEPAQPVPADQQILDRPVQRVAHMQRAGYVGGGTQMTKVSSRRAPAPAA